MTDHFEMRKAHMKAIDADQLIKDLDDVILKPSHYNLIESTTLFKRCKETIEALIRIAEANGYSPKN